MTKSWPVTAPALRGFSGHRVWVQKMKMGARQLAFELVVKLVQLPGQVLSIPLYVGGKKNERSNSLGIK
jgi:hypothetical protein